MKKIYYSLTILFILALSSACTTNTTDRSYEMGESNQFDMTLNYIASKQDLRSATINALTLKKWSLQREGDAVRARLDHGGVSARLLITFETDTIHINSRGSNIDGKAIVPLRLINNLNAVIKKELTRLNR